MCKIMISHLVFSSLYFVLALFTILMLILAGCFQEFGQMFRLTTQPFGVYFNIGIVLLVCGVIVALSHIARIYTSYLPKIYSLAIGIVLCVFLFLIYGEVFLLEPLFIDFFSLKDSMTQLQEEDFYKNSYQILADYTFYVLFVLLPAVVIVCNLSFDKSTLLGRILHSTQPNFNVILCALFGFAIMPFLKSGIYGYIDLTLLLLGLSLVVYLCFRHGKKLDSYEYFNLFLLLVVCIVMLSGDFESVNGGAYFEVRKAFYTLVLLGWSNGWMMQLTINTNKSA